MLSASYAAHGLVLELRAEHEALLAAAGARLAGFDPAVGTPDISFELLLRRPDEPARVQQPDTIGRTVYDPQGGGTIVFHPEAGVVYGEIDEGRLLADPVAGTARIEASAAEGRPLYVAAYPLLTIALMEALKARGRYSLHAACVADGDRGILLAGPSGAGKSTLSLALGRSGLGFLSDDMVFLTPDGEQVRALGFADVVGVTARSSEFFPELPAAEPQPGFPKRLIRASDAMAIRDQATCLPAHLVMPSVDAAAEPALRPLDPREAWLALVPDVLLTEPRAAQAHLQTLATLLEQVQCHELTLGPDLDRCVALVRELL